MNSINISKEPKKYYDARKFKGNTFEKNISSINDMYFGQGIQISDTPFIILDENDQQKLLSAYSFIIESKNGEIKKVIYHPETFLQLIFHYDNLLFNLNSRNKLVVFKLENNQFYKYEFPQMIKLKEENEIKIKEVSKEEKPIDKSKIDEIKSKMAKIKEKGDLIENYEILLDIFYKDLAYPLENEKPKQLNKSLKFEINLGDIYSCTISKISLQVDGCGKLSETIKVNKGKINILNGI